MENNYYIFIERGVNMTAKEDALKYGEIVAKCWENEEFKQSFLSDPETILEQYGIELKEGIDYKVIESPKLVEYIVLPHDGTKEALVELSKKMLQQAENKQSIIPEGTEVRIIQNTEDTNYLILPPSPKTLTSAELALVSGGDSLYANVDVALVQTEAVVTTTTVSLEAEAYLGVVAVGVIVLI